MLRFSIHFAEVNLSICALGPFKSFIRPSLRPIYTVRFFAMHHMFLQFKCPIHTTRIFAIRHFDMQKLYLSKVIEFVLIKTNLIFYYQKGRFVLNRRLVSTSLYMSKCSNNNAINCNSVLNQVCKDSKTHSSVLIFLEF